MKRLLLIYILIAGCTTLFAQSFKLPKYEKFTLKNGLTVYLMEQHEVPVINFAAILPAGAIYDAAKPGLADFTSTALMHGSKKYPKEILDEKLDFVGASIQSNASKEAATINAKFLSKDRELVFDIIKDVMLNPAFPVSEFDKEKKRVLVKLEQQKESPRNIIGSYFDKFIYGNHVYGNVVSGSVKTVAGITPEDMRHFYQQNYGPQGSAIAVVGDFNSKDMKKVITAMFSGWKKTPGTNINTTSGTPTKPNAARVLLINKDDARETTFYIGAPGVSRNNPDWIALQVVNTYFGGRFTSLLNDELRVNTGLTYGARSAFQPLKSSGTFYISTFTANKTTGEAIDKSLEVLNNFHKKGIDENSLTSARNYVKGQFPPRYETSGQLASLLTEMFWYNFDEKFINEFENKVDELSVEKANGIIAKYFPKENLQFVLVGKAEEIKPIATRLGKVIAVDIKGDAVDLKLQ